METRIDRVLPGTVPYSKEQSLQIFDHARRKDVETEGEENTYDTRSGAINFWTHNWIVPGGIQKSQCIGSIYLNWEKAHIWLVASDEGFGEEDVFKELGKLEKAAFGEIVNGRESS